MVEEMAEEMTVRGKSGSGWWQPRVAMGDPVTAGGSGGLQWDRRCRGTRGRSSGGHGWEFWTANVWPVVKEMGDGGSSGGRARRRWGGTQKTDRWSSALRKMARVAIGVMEGMETVVMHDGERWTEGFDGYGGWWRWDLLGGFSRRKWRWTAAEEMVVDGYLMRRWRWVYGVDWGRCGIMGDGGRAEGFGFHGWVGDGQTMDLDEGSCGFGECVLRVIREMSKQRRRSRGRRETGREKLRKKKRSQEKKHRNTQIFIISNSSGMLIEE